jgi:hypothetical protein
VTVRGGLFEPDTPLGEIMATMFDTDPDDPEILAVEEMSYEEVAREAAEIRARLRREGHFVVGPP